MVVPQRPQNAGLCFCATLTSGPGHLPLRAILARGDAARLLRQAAKLFVNSSPGTLRPGPICHFPTPPAPPSICLASYAWHGLEWHGMAWHSQVPQPTQEVGWGFNALKSWKFFFRAFQNRQLAMYRAGW